MPGAACRRAIHQKLDINMTDAREESELALNVSIQHVLDRTGLKPSQVRTHTCGCCKCRAAMSAAWSLSVSITRHVLVCTDLIVSASTSCAPAEVSERLRRSRKPISCRSSYGFWLTPTGESAHKSLSAAPRRVASGSCLDTKIRLHRYLFLTLVCVLSVSCAPQIDGLIINCTAFNPTPSLSAAVVKHFKFKSSIRTVNLSGMGCAASVISVDIARDMLKVMFRPCTQRACCSPSTPTAA